MVWGPCKIIFGGKKNKKKVKYPELDIQKLPNGRTVAVFHTTHAHQNFALGLFKRSISPVRNTLSLTRLFSGHTPDAQKRPR